MTFYEPTPSPYAVGEEVFLLDKEIYERPTWITGKITEKGDETVVIKWEDLEDETEYNLADMPDIKFSKPVEKSMGAEEILAGEKLVAVFMGATIKIIDDSFDYRGTWEKSEREEVFGLSQSYNYPLGYLVTGGLKYHSSWDWLMPVVEKIEAMGYKTIIGGGDMWRNYMNIMYGIETKYNGYTETKALGKGGTKIEAVWQAVVSFIQWLNKQHPAKECDTTM